MDEKAPSDGKLLRILRTSAAIFAEKGYHQASIREIAAATGMSLSGLYHYFRSKEQLLFLIQDHCFSTLLTQLALSLEGLDDPEERFRAFVRNHLAYFVNNMQAMKVLSHEANVLTNEYRRIVTDKKRRYTREAMDIIAALRPHEGAAVRASTFSLFGMMNWVYNWYRPDRDLGVEELSEQMSDLFLEGLRRVEIQGVSPGDDEADAGRRLSIWTTPP